MAVSVLVPRFADDESGGILAAWFCAEGASVAAGELIACLERDHVAYDVEAESDGILYRGLALGERSTAGDMVAFIAPPTPGAVAEPDDAAPEPIPFPTARQPESDHDTGDAAAAWEAAAGESDRPFAWSTAQDVEPATDDPGSPAADAVEAMPAPAALEPEDNWDGAEAEGDDAMASAPEMAPAGQPADIPAAFADRLATEAGEEDAAADESAWGLLTPEEASATGDLPAEDDEPAVELAMEMEEESAEDASPAYHEVETSLAPAAGGMGFDEVEESYGIEAPRFDLWQSASQGDLVAESATDVGPVDLVEEPGGTAADAFPAFIRAFEDDESEPEPAEAPEDAWDAAVAFLDETAGDDDDALQAFEGDPETDAEDVDAAGAEDPAGAMTYEWGWPSTGHEPSEVPAANRLKVDDEDAIPEGEDAFADEASVEPSPASTAWDEADEEPAEDNAAAVPAQVRNLHVEVDLTAATVAFSDAGDFARSPEEIVARAVATALSGYEGYDEVTGGVAVCDAGADIDDDAGMPGTACVVTSYAPYGVHAADAPIPPGHGFAFAMGAVRETVAFHGQSLVPVRMVTLSFAYDPAVVRDGEAASLLARVRDLLEAPADLMAA